MVSHSRIEPVVIVPTRNRGERVVDAANSIIRNAYSQYQLFIIDQSDNDSSAELLHNMGIMEDKRVVYHQSDQRGVSKGRNCGISNSKGNLLLFTDDDCTVPPNWIGDYVRLFTARPEIDIAFGPVCAPPGNHDGWIPEFLPENEGFVRPSRDVVNHLGFGANFAVRRRACQRIGGFDTLLGPGADLRSGEDTDFALRGLQLGLGVFVSMRPAVVHHGERLGRELDESRDAYLHGMAALCLKHVRCGDVKMAVPVVEELWRWSSLAAGHALRGRRPSGIRPALSVLRGAGASWQYGVNRERRVYVER